MAEDQNTRQVSVYKCTSQPLRTSWAMIINNEIAGDAQGSGSHAALLVGVGDGLNWKGAPNATEG